MVCTEYQERINEVALAGLGAMGAGVATADDAGDDAVLAQHVSGCAGCRAELERLRALLARIDSGVAAMVAVEPSPALAVMVRQRIARESVASTSRTFGQRWGWWIGAAAGATAAILIAVVLRGPERPTIQPQNAAAEQAGGAVAASSHVAAANANPAGQQTKGLKRATLLRSRATTSATAAAVVHESESSAPSLEVLIPSNQRIALVQLATAAAHNKLDDRILVREAATAPPAAIEVKPLKIDLLESLDSQVGDGSEKLY